MPDNQQTIECFYGAFARLDADTMAACYAPDAVFDDEAFSLRGAREVGGMWKMLCQTTAGNPTAREVWRLAWRDIRADDTSGQAHWDAHYRFSSTGRIVDNSIDARFSFNPTGQIASHRDSFDFWSWSRQALGAPGYLLGWTPLLRNKVRAQADASLRSFLAKDTK